ncbi:MAG: biotin synthase BioB [Leptonema sp. (in: bacteria)]
MNLLKEIQRRIEERLEREPEKKESLIEFNEAKELINYSGEVLVSLAEPLRKHYYKNYVFVHILNNIRNGNCSEDCGYCIQRKTQDSTEIPIYNYKTEEEILKEAELAKKQGAYRYCLVSSGKGTNRKLALKYAEIIKKIIKEINIKVCLSAGIITDPEVSKILKEAGLDRYNHNLNTSRKYYKNITTTHTYEEREITLKNLSNQNIGLCSGVIAGMGETYEDLIELALELNRLGAESIPVNFFIPIPGHAVKNYKHLSEEECLKILALFRLTNPKSEIRMAAGREIYLKEKQPIALKVANSLFVSGYLNVKGSDVQSTLKMIYDNGFQLDPNSEIQINFYLQQTKGNSDLQEQMGIQLKTLQDLRPFFRK